MIDPQIMDLPCPQVVEEILRNLRPGVRTSLVAMIEMTSEDDRHQCRSLLMRQPFILEAKLPPGACKVGILGGIVSKSHLGIHIKVLDPSFVLNIPVTTEESCYRLVETCVGLGALGKGASYAHFQPTTANEIQESFVKVLKHSTNAKVVQGDVGKLHVVRDIWLADPAPSSLACGFSCQPFSKAGDRQQQFDDRSRHSQMRCFFRGSFNHLS